MNKLFIPLLVLAFLVTACGSQQPSNTRFYAGGNAGVVISFEPDAPPDYVTAGGDFPFEVGIRMENKGETTVDMDDMHIELKGLDAREFGVNNSDDFRSTADDDLLAVRLNPDTGKIESFAPVSEYFALNHVEDLPGNHEFPIVIDACYVYQTRAIGELCIKKNLLDSKNTKVCIVSGPKKFEYSGAPVAIANFQEYTQGSDKIRFTFEVSRGAGKVFENGTECAYGFTNAQARAAEDKVMVRVKTGIEGDFSCQGFTTDSDGVASGVVKLVSGSRTVSCVQQIPESERQDKTKLVNIWIDYDFQESIITKILVKSSGENE
ncbi:MAG: hypothetical protein V1725_03045 [archaeon]